MPSSPRPGRTLIAPLDLYVEWPTHGRSLQLGEVVVRRGDSLETVFDRVWDELVRVARELNLPCPTAFRAVRLEWPARDGRSGQVAVRPQPDSQASDLRAELVSALGVELTQFGFAWAATGAGAAAEGEARPA